MGVVPQRDRRSRPIVDYTYSAVNTDTISSAHQEAMQFGHALDRVLHRIYYASRRYGPPFVIKVDLADGFYRVPLLPADMPALACAFPNRPDEPLLVAIPLLLPMGWVASPPLFCSLTETITDIANDRFKNDPAKLPLHQLTQMADRPDNETPVLSPTPAHPSSLPPTVPVPHHRYPLTGTQHYKPLQYVDVYMDNFIAVAQGHPNLLKRVRTILFETIDQVLRPLHPSDAPIHRKEPISIKKLNKGDAR